MWGRGPAQRKNNKKKKISSVLSLVFQCLLSIAKQQGKLQVQFFSPLAGTVRDGEKKSINGLSQQIVVQALRVLNRSALEEGQCTQDAIFSNYVNVLLLENLRAHLQLSV